MLFALDWIEGVRTGLASFLVSILDSMNFHTLSVLLGGQWFWMAVNLILGATLCFYGFRRHRAVHGVYAAIFLGSFGWFLGIAANPDTVAIAWVYAVMMVLIGFFGVYILYFLNTFAMAFLFIVAAGSPFRTAFLGTSVFFSIILAFVICVVYVKYKMVMSSVFGGCLLGLIFYRFSPHVGFAVGAVCIVAGILVQRKLEQVYQENRRRALEKQVKKYPYGPGIAYGWEDPTVEKTFKNT